MVIPPPATVWSNSAGEYNQSGVLYLVDPSGIFIVDPSGNNIVDTGETYTPEPATVWGQDTEESVVTVWVPPSEGEMVMVGSVPIVTNSGLTIVTNSGNTIVTNPDQFIPTLPTVWTEDDTQ